MDPFQLNSDASRLEGGADLADRFGQLRQQAWRGPQHATQLKGVESLEFRYYDGRGWTTNWDSSTAHALPVAVEIRLWLIGGTSLGPTPEDRELADREELADESSLRSELGDMAAAPTMPIEPLPQSSQFERVEVGMIDRGPDLRRLVVLQPPLDTPSAPDAADDDSETSADPAAGTPELPPEDRR